jgi:subtilisin family serine protease
VLDTGLATDDLCGDHVGVVVRDPEPWGPTKYDQSLPAPHPYTLTDNFDHPDENSDQWLDPVSGHGTFIAGLLRRLAHGVSVELGRVLETTGEGNDADLAFRIGLLADDPPDLLCLSLGCYTDDDVAPLGMSTAIAALQAKGTVVGASAGNDASCRVSWPAALPGVVSVGALGPHGPAPFTNFGSWVRASAPGIEVVSSFFEGVDDDGDGVLTSESFSGWASWSGTSFSAPIVSSAIAREMLLYGIDASAAVSRVVDDERLFRFPGLGTVVNLH